MSISRFSILTDKNGGSCRVEVRNEEGVDFVVKRDELYLNSLNNLLLKRSFEVVDKL